MHYHFLLFHKIKKKNIYLLWWVFRFSAIFKLLRSNNLNYKNVSGATFQKSILIYSNHMKSVFYLLKKILHWTRSFCFCFEFYKFLLPTYLKHKKCPTIIAIIDLILNFLNFKNFLAPVKCYKILKEFKYVKKPFFFKTTFRKKYKVIEILTFLVTKQTQRSSSSTTLSIFVARGVKLGTLRRTS